MEVHARYVLMGIFALAVIGFGLAFVYWLETGAGIGDRVSYRIRFSDPVVGLAKGSAVLFNGVRIGEVTRLELSAESPKDVMVGIAVDRTAPVRNDTRVGIEFQGLAGAPAIALAGGSPGLPLLALDRTEARLLTADKEAGQTMTQAARNVLRNLDAVITDNAAPLRSAIASIDTFTGALARNSDKIDRIMVGLDRLTGGGGKPRTRIFDLQAATSFPSIPGFPRGVLQIPEPITLAQLESEKILLGDTPSDQAVIAQWPDMLPRVVQAGLMRSFENAGYKKIVGRAPEAAKVDYQLLVEIRRFQIQTWPATSADVEVGVRVMQGGGAVSEVEVFAAREPVGGAEPQQAAEALNRAFGTVAAQVVAWTCHSLAGGARKDALDQRQPR